MKISESGGPKVPDGLAKSASGGPRGEDFKAVMEEALRTSGTVDGPPPGLESTPAPHGIQGIESLCPIRLQGGDGIQSGLFRELEKVLDAVAFYAEKLADTALPAKDLAPLLEQLQERVAGLNQLGSGREIPERVGAILSDVNITLGAEIARFRRGDYGTITME